MQFVRFAPLVKKHFGTVFWKVRELVRLFKSCAGVDQVVINGEALPAFDVHAPLLSLPGVLGTTWPQSRPRSRIFSPMPGLFAWARN